MDGHMILKSITLKTNGGLIDIHLRENKTELRERRRKQHPRSCAGLRIASMARGKVQLKRIENPVHRQVTFCKRRASLLKKARELSVLCDADIGVVVFSNHGKLFELATKGTLKGLIERYKMACGDTADANQAELISEFKQEISILKQEIYLQHRCLRFMLGEEAAELMTVDELVALERHLQAWMHHIRARKMQIIFQAIQSLKNKEDMLTAANEILQGKILEQYWLFDVSPYHN